MMNENSETKKDQAYKRIGEIYARRENQLANYARSKLADQDKSYAEDVVQTSFEALLRHMDKIDIYDEREVCSFLWVVARNESHNYYRKHKNYYCVEPDKINAKSSYIQIQDGRMSFDRLMQYVRQLPSKYADVIILSGVLGFAYEDIAEILDIQRDTVRQRIHRARFKIMNLMEDEPKA